MLHHPLYKQELTGLIDSAIHFIHWIQRKQLFIFRANMFSTTSLNTKREELEDLCKKINGNWEEDKLILILDLQENVVVFSLEHWINKKIDSLTNELLSEIK